MKPIKAFVGHSFASADTEIVGRFLKYFDQVKGLHPSFTWEHAEAAEPRELAEKVLSIIADKNVFIGICTRRERVVAPQSLTPLLLQPSMAKAKQSDILWKTSDWVIQEIGLAIGRGMDLILLIEEGLRPPGGLQGNIECIPFDRSNPEKADGKILEMLRALSPKSAQAGTVATADAPTPETEAKDGAGSENLISPKPEWEVSDFRRAIFLSIVQERAEDVAKVTAAYMESEDAKAANHAAEWEANAEFIRISFRKGGSLEKLMSVAREHPTRGTAVSLAMALESYGNYRAAADAFEKASEVATELSDKQRLQSFAATNLIEAGETDAGLLLLQRLRAAPSVDAIEKDLLEAIKKGADITKSRDIAVAAMERIVEIAPDDWNTRFALAYKHSEMEDQEMAIHHYLRIPPSERASMTWNNLGVALDHFKMPSNSVRAYRNAEENEETLAMSNLGYKLMNAGFLDEAKAIFDRALVLPDYHKNIALGLSRLKEIPDEEEERRAQVLEAVRPKAEFFRSLGRAIVKPTPVSIGTKWRGPSCELVVTRSGNKFRAEGSYEIEGGGLALGVFGSGFQQSTKYKVQYEGTISGCQIDGSVRRIREGDVTGASSLLGLNDTKTKILIEIETGGKISVAENPHGSSPRFYNIVVIA